MLRGIDLTAQNCLRAFYSQNSDLFAQTFARAVNFLLHIRLGLCCNPCGFNSSMAFSVFHDLRGTFFRISHQFRNLTTTVGQEFCNFFFCLFKIAFPTFGCRQTFRDFIGALVKCLSNRRPHIFHCEPHQNTKDNYLRKYGCI